MYLERRKQYVTINNTHNIFQILFPGVPQGSVPRPILFNIFINDFFLCISNSDQLNLADDKTNCVAENIIEEITSTLEKQIDCKQQLNGLNQTK